ncbi:DUF4235 domain-containing protein [Rhodococcus sp. X156]|uniref:DUF4235 domain-containing protein n=1 Tax=Rhodococcus sp. X156 TaxID=2499145 RepID=UPI000FD8840F|nr:DUF4235 domain-containing protein [Rhodococcus sp. X156]
MSAVNKVLYKPLSLLASVLGGLAASAIFGKLWGRIGDDEKKAPKPDDLRHSTREVLLAAVLQGAIFALVRAAVDRASAKGYRKMTGQNPT